MHSNILKYKHFQPKIHCSAFISDTAVITGDVTIGDGSSVWFNAVLRGDVASIKIGEKTNIQDGSIIHVSRNGGNSFIGNNVTVGHKVLLHACRLCDECFIGMGSIILDGAIVESGAMLAAGSLLTGGKKINSGELWAGSPAKFFRKLTAEESKSILISSENYYNLAQEYMDKKQWGKKMAKKVLIYTKSYCPYCVKAKQLLKNKNIEFLEIDVTNDQLLLEEMLAKSSGRKTVPQIFIDDFHVGGCDDLYALNEKGNLDDLLR